MRIKLWVTVIADYWSVVVEEKRMVIDEERISQYLEVLRQAFFYFELLVFLLHDKPEHNHGYRSDDEMNGRRHREVVSNIAECECRPIADDSLITDDSLDW